MVQAANDVQQLVPMAEAIVKSVGRRADTTSAESGYFSAQNVEHPSLAQTNLLVPPPPQKKTTAPAAPALQGSASAAVQMREKLAETEGHALYKRRKAIVEPVFGQIKDARGFRRFLLRGLAAVSAEFNFIALTHNLLKLFRFGGRPVMS